MPDYLYDCSAHGPFHHFWSIRADSSQAPCPACWRVCRKVIQVPYVNVAERTREVNATEARWSKDMAAYKRMHDQGLRPGRIDGSALMEAKANSRTELEMMRLAPNAQAVKDGNEVSSEVFGRDLTE